MKKNTLSKWSSLLLLIAAVMLVVSLITPIWSIYLSAPQYPEGLAMFLHANRISGEYEIINGLNHYIGMKEIHADEFWEFTFLPYIIGFFILLCVLTAILKKRTLLVVTLIAFLLFGIGFLADFYRWLYDYGHNLDPNAAIIVPGMSYQPPLIGYKQLLNFEVWSYPNVGGIMLVLVGVILGAVTIYEYRRKSRTSKTT